MGLAMDWVALEWHEESEKAKDARQALDQALAELFAELEQVKGAKCELQDKIAYLIKCEDLRTATDHLVAADRDRLAKECEELREAVLKAPYRLIGLWVCPFCGKNTNMCVGNIEHAPDCIVRRIGEKP